MARRPVRARLLPCIAVILALAGACANVEVVDQVEQGAYDRCDSPAWPEARAALERGDEAAACAALMRVVQTCPDFVPAHEAWIDVARELGGAQEEAMRAYYEGTPDRPNSPVLPWARARLERTDSRKVDLLDEAVARDASFYPAYVDLAEVWGRSDRTAKQLDYLEKAVQANPEWPEANLGLARVLVSVGRGEEAVPYFETYLRARPDDLESVRQFVRLLLYDLGRVEPADPFIDRLLTASPEDSSALMDAGAAAWLRGDRERAAAAYRRVLALDPRDARAALNLGNLWFQRPDRADEQRREDWRKARAAYRYFLGLDSWDDVHDLQDLMVSVPYRLEVIASALGPLPDDAPPPRLGDF